LIGFRAFNVDCKSTFRKQRIVNPSQWDVLCFSGCELPLIGFRAFNVDCKSTSCWQRIANPSQQVDP